jgi:hypothetical protein
MFEKQVLFDCSPNNFVIISQIKDFKNFFIVNERFQLFHE